jgi:hypothetical protein
MSTLTMNDGGLTTQDPHDVMVYEMDWSENLETDVNILTSAWTITVEKGTAGLTADNSKRSGQITQIRLGSGVLGSLYKATNQIVTNETPAQTKERSFLILIEDL